MTEPTLIEKLRQIAGSKMGVPPPCLSEPNVWVDALARIAGEAVFEIERLQAYMPRWQPIDTAPVPAWDSPEARRGYGLFKCIGQLVSRDREPPWITTLDAYYVAAPYVAAPRSTEKRVLRWRDGAGHQCFPEYWMPLPEPCSEDARSKP